LEMVLSEYVTCGAGTLEYVTCGAGTLVVAEIPSFLKIVARCFVFECYLLRLSTTSKA